MNDCDTLTNLLLDCEETGASPRETADYLIERGVRPPARVVTTVEELDALPARSAVDAAGRLCKHLGDGWWVEAGDHEMIHSETVLGMSEGVGPVTVLSTPAEKAGR